MKILFVMLFSTLTLAQTVIYNPEGGFYKWGADKRCYSCSQSGRVNHEVNDAFCGADYYAWASNKFCYRYAGSGRRKKMVNDIFCNQN